MIHLSHSVSGDQIAAELCADTEELARCLAAIAKHLNTDSDRVANEIGELHNELIELNVCKDIRALGVILQNMQG